MLKSILNLKGTQGLSKNEQKEITGGNLIPVPVDCTFTSSTHLCYLGQGVIIDGKCCVSH